MNNIYQPPQSDLETNEPKSASFDRSLWLLIPVNLYLWIKIIDYADLYYWTIREATLFEVLTLSINIPVYLSAIFYVFKVRLLPNLFWKIWIVIAILDEVRASIEYYSGFVDLILYTSPIIPLYVIGVIYAYLSPTIWQRIAINQ